MRFLVEDLPPKGAFFSKLRGEDISDVDYEHAQLGCETMGDYHDAYLKADVCLLADVFKKLQTNMQKALFA